MSPDYTTSKKLASRIHNLTPNITQILLDLSVVITWGCLGVRPEENVPVIWSQQPQPLSADMQRCASVDPATNLLSSRSF